MTLREFLFKDEIAVVLRLRIFMGEIVCYGCNTTRHSVFGALAGEHSSRVGGRLCARCLMELRGQGCTLLGSGLDLGLIQQQAVQYRRDDGMATHPTVKS